jgi:alkylation response protein AidB-like acyl-CoA dehydrogenase
MPRQIEENVEVVPRVADGSIALCIAMTNRSRGAPPRSLRSSEVVAGSTMSAWRAVAVHHGSWTMIVSRRRQARRNRFRS